MSHPIHRRLLAERLLALRRSTEGRRYASAQRSGRIDPNPHQIDAVIFALGRVREGGCILADEVGLGKTIEAGLVMAQLRAEGASRILLVAPKALVGQWRQELFTLFGVSVREPGNDPAGFEGSGVFLIGRDLLGSDAALGRMHESGPFDLCVVDEAHEIFSGIYRRFNRSGQYLEDSPHAKLAGRLRALLGGRTPVLLLTATPLQNSLAELWGLVQYVDPSGTLLGDLPTFRQMFCADDDRVLLSGQAADLQRRMQVVVQRTLRRQAQEFMKTPFVGRRTRLFEYTMTPDERALYDDVTRYLLTPDLAAFHGATRRLLVLGFHRRMASSHRALAASLERVAERLRGMLDRSREPEALSLAEPGEEDADEDELDARAPQPEAEPGTEQVQRELELVESFVERLGALETDSKASALLEALRVLEAEAARGQGSGKLVIFTESLATQEYLRRLLIDAGGVADEEITLFRGENTSERARAALAVWEAEVGASLGPGARPVRDVALRLALVHEFRERSRVFISTEAGAKGLNLQFCDTVINYDLPWNPQRIEQRIGRVHRYGQTRDVTVINFLMRDNAAERLTFEILSRKLELFGRVLDASDHVLYEPGRRASGAALAALGDELAAELRRIYRDARSVEQIEAELLRVASELDARKRDVELSQQRTLELIESRFDAAVRQTFRHIAAELPAHLRDLDRDLERLVLGYLDGEGIRYRRSEGSMGVDIRVEAAPRLPEGYRNGFALHVGGVQGLEGGEVLHVAHPLVSLAVEAARAGTSEVFRVRVGLEGAAAPRRLAGQRGRLRVLKLRYPGFEPVDRLLPVVVLAGSGEVLERGASWQLLDGPLEALPGSAQGGASSVSDEELTEAVQEALFLDEREVSSVEHRLFERAIQQLERFIEDRVLVLRRRRDELLGRMETLRRERNAAIGAEARGRAEAALERCERELVALDGQLGRLQSRDDDGYQRWRQRAYERRYTPPACESIVEAEFVIG